MKLRAGWEAHGRQWWYKPNDYGFHCEAVLQITVHGCKRFEAHYEKMKPSGFRDVVAISQMRRFSTRDEAFDFCEKMYDLRMKIRNQDDWLKYKEEYEHV